MLPGGQHLGEADGQRFCSVYGITREGNFENTGKSNPTLLSGDPAVRQEMAALRQRLLEARNKRPQPGRDEKCLVAWNALLAGAMARAGFVFGEKSWFETAIRIGDWIWNSMRDGEDRLAAVAYDGEATGDGTLNDYAYSAEACLSIAAGADWMSPGSSGEWIVRATRLLEAAEKGFKDPDGLGYFFTRKGASELVHRKKDWYDNATPAGNSCLLHANTLLEALVEDRHFAETSTEMSTAYPGIVNTSPAAASHALSAMVYRAIGIAVVKVRPGTDLDSLRQALVERPWRPVFLLVDESVGQEGCYQLCVATRCLAPTDSVEEIVEAL